MRKPGPGVHRIPPTRRSRRRTWASASTTSPRRCMDATAGSGRSERRAARQSRHRRSDCASDGANRVGFDPASPSGARPESWASAASARRARKRRSWTSSSAQPPRKQALIGAIAIGRFRLVFMSNDENSGEKKTPSPRRRRWLRAATGHRTGRTIGPRRAGHRRSEGRRAGLLVAHARSSGASSRRSTIWPSPITRTRTYDSSAVRDRQDLRSGAGLQGLPRDRALRPGGQAQARGDRRGEAPARAGGRDASQDR